MQPIRRLSIAEQTAEHLREGLREGRWSEGLPGVLRLAALCQVSKGAVRTALRMLEKEGLVQGNGGGKSRRLAESAAGTGGPPPLRVGIFLHEPMVTENPAMQSALYQLQHDLEAAGHVCFFTGQCQSGLHHDPERIAKYIAPIGAEAWVVVAARRPVLEWFATQPIPTMAFGGGSPELALAATGIDARPSTQAAVRALLAHGHQRIVLICPARQREPVPGQAWQILASELEAHGLRWSRGFNVPDWEETPEGFRVLLNGLFGVTPPTALLIDESPRVLATLAFLAERGWRVPGRVSLVATLWDNALGWCHPPLAHIRADAAPLLHRIVRWVGAVRQGTPDRKLIRFPEEFVPGGSIGPVWHG